MRYRLTKKAQTFAKGGGYQSRIGERSRSSDPVHPSMAGRHNSSVPPLGLEYKGVERTADANYGAIVLKLNDESATRSEEAMKKASDDYMKALQDEDLTPQAQMALREQLNIFEGDMQKNMESDPMFYANGVNRQRLAQQAGKIVSLENLSKARSQMSDIRGHLKKHQEAGSLMNTYRDENGNTVWDAEQGRELTNQDVYDIAFKPDHALFSKVMKTDGPGQIGTFNPNARAGNIDHSLKWVTDYVATLKPDSFSTEKISNNIQTIDELNKMLRTDKRGVENISNAEKVEMAKQLIAKNWRSEMGPEASEGLENSMRQQVNNMRAVSMNGTALAGNMSFAQAMAEAQRNGDGDAYQQLAQTRDRLIELQGEKWLSDRMDLGKQTSTKRTHDQNFNSLNMGDTGRSKKGGSGEDGGGFEIFGKLLSSDAQTSGFTRSYLGSGAEHAIPMAGESSFAVDGEAPRNVSVDGTYYLLEGGYGTSGADGAALKGSNTTQFTDASKVGNRVRYVLNGKKMERQKDGTYAPVAPDKSLANKLVTLNEKNAAGLTKDAIKVTDETGTYFDTGKARYYVSEQAFHEYKTATGGVLLKPMNKRESYVYFGQDYSRTTPALKVFKETRTDTDENGTPKLIRSGLTHEAKELLNWEIKRMKAKGVSEDNIKLAEQMRDELAAGRKPSPAEIAFLEQNLPELRNVQEKEHIASSFPEMKEVQQMPASMLLKRLGVDD